MHIYGGVCPVHNRKTDLNTFSWKFQDLAVAFIKVLGNEKASREVFNISGDKYVTFDGLAKACAKVKTILVTKLFVEEVMPPWLLLMKILVMLTGWWFS